MLKAIEVKTNSKGVKYALATENYNVFGVYKLCSNYSRTAKDGITKTWRYVKKDLPLEQAMALFAARTK